MIVVRGELHSAITRKVTELARMHICNVGGTRELGDYEVQTLRGRSREELDKRKVNRVGEVSNHARLTEHVWHLVAKALKAVNYGEKK